MKKIFFLLFSAVVLLASCDKLKSLADINFDVNYSEKINVDGLPGDPFIPAEGLTTSIPPFSVETKSEENIKKYNTSSELIKDVKLGEMKLTMEEPASQNFDLVDSIWLYVSAPGQPEVLAAYKYNISKGTKVVDMTTSDANLRDYFLQKTMTFRLAGHFYDTPDSATRFAIDGKFNIVANPLED